MGAWRNIFEVTYRSARRIVIMIVGGTVVLIGIIMIVTPGPATVVIPLGLGILSIEFAFARRWLAQLKQKSVDAARAITGKKSTDSDE